jgi:hypothetical protein
MAFEFLICSGNLRQYWTIASSGKIRSQGLNDTIGFQDAKLVRR